MDKHYLSLIINEVKNFEKLQKEWGYEDINDLIGHYIEEDVISSRKELFKVLKALKQKLRVVIKAGAFAECWAGRN